MDLEKWPLLQAYGLEGVARGGFFTMNHEVSQQRSPHKSTHRYRLPCLTGD